MPFNLGFGEILLILIVALLVFGGRLPEVGRSLGKGLVEFKKGLRGSVDDLEEELEPGEEPAVPPEEEPPRGPEGS